MSKERVGKLVDVVRCCEDEHLGVAQRVDARLHCHVLLSVPVALVLIRELVDVVEKDDGRSVLRRLLEDVLDALDERPVGGVLATDVRRPPTLLDETASHERLAHARLPIEQQGSCRAGAEPVIGASVAQVVRRATERLLDALITKDCIECAHVSSLHDMGCSHHDESLRKGMG